MFTSHLSRLAGLSRVHREQDHPVVVGEDVMFSTIKLVGLRCPELVDPELRIGVCFRETEPFDKDLLTLDLTLS